MENEVFEFTFWTSKRKDATSYVKKYRALTLDEMKNLVVGSRIPFIARGNVIKQIKVTSVKTWKTRRDVHVGLKYGLYEFGYSELIDHDGRLVHHGETLVTELMEGELNV